MNMPKYAGKAREDYILNAVKSGQATIEYCSINYKKDDNEATFFVFKDALKIDGIRVNVSAYTQQKIADCLGCTLLTAKLADLIFMKADVIIKPKPRRIDASTKAMIEHSKDIDKEVAGRKGLISTVGKHWIIDNKLVRPRFPNQSANYGWHFKGGLPGIKGELPVSYKEMPGVRLIQSIGTFHDSFHTDYSQTCILVAQECEINGIAMDIRDVFKHPEYSYLVNHSGPLSIIRQPNVPETKVITVIPDKIGITSNHASS